jgi:hypothetical protein
MTTLMLEDIPLMEELSDGAARKIVGGRWNDGTETPAGKLMNSVGDPIAVYVDDVLINHTGNGYAG